MPKVTYLHTEKDERIKEASDYLMQKYGLALHIPQACEVIGCSKWTLYALVKSRKIAYRRSKGATGRIVFGPSDIAQYMERVRTEAVK